MARWNVICLLITAIALTVSGKWRYSPLKRSQASSTRHYRGHPNWCFLRSQVERKSRTHGSLFDVNSVLTLMGMREAELGKIGPYG